MLHALCGVSDARWEDQFHGCGPLWFWFVWVDDATGVAFTVPYGLAQSHDTLFELRELLAEGVVP